jgi:hypothetical protein
MCLCQMFNDIIDLGGANTWIKCYFSNCAFGRVQYCVRNWLLNLKRNGRWRRSGCGGLINILSISLITWRSVISICSSRYINCLKHIDLIGALRNIPMVGMTCVALLRRARILCNQMFVMNWLGGTLQKFSDFLTNEGSLSCSGIPHKSFKKT